MSTVTPTLDGDVLAVLAQQDATFTTGQLNRILTRASEDGLRKALRRLAKQGIVLSDRVGNAYIYSLNREHLAAAYIVGLAGLMTTFLARLTRELEMWEARPRYAAVFGSAALGTMSADSDLDLLLIRPDNVGDDLWDAQVDRLVEMVTRWTGNDARPLQFTTSDLASAGDDAVLRDVLAHGLTVAGTQAWLSKQLRRSKVPK
jgi:hypothetical protein